EERRDPGRDRVRPPGRSTDRRQCDHRAGLRDARPGLAGPAQHHRARLPGDPGVRRRRDAVRARDQPPGRHLVRVLQPEGETVMTSVVTPPNKTSVMAALEPEPKRTTPTRAFFS